MYVDEKRIAEVLRYEALIPAVRQALIDYSTGRVDQPLRQVMRVAAEATASAAGDNIGWFAVMPVISGRYMAVKTVTFYPGNGEAPKPLPTHLATIELLDRATGEPLAVMDGRLITEMRTAAVSAVACQALAPWMLGREPQTLGVVGSGVQARSHIEALRMVCPAFRETEAVKVWSRDAGKAGALAAEVGAEAVAIEAAAACDVVVTATSSPTPVLAGRWQAERSLVLAVGAVGPKLRELDDEAMRGYLVAESRQGTENESGDVILSGARVEAEIGEILAGVRSLPESPKQPGRAVFKSLGMAVEDLAGAVLVYEALRGKG